MKKFLFILLALSVSFQAYAQSNPPTGLDDLQKLEADQLAAMERLKQVRESMENQREVNEALSKSPTMIAEVLSKHDTRLKTLETPVGAEARPEIQKNLDTTFIVLAALLVFFMQAGFGMFELGIVRAKNAINVVMKNILDLSVASISYLLIGFSLMFGFSEGGFIGSLYWLPGMKGDSDLWSMFLFQSVFAATACTIASGAMAERTKFVGYVIYTSVFAGLIYPIFGHWAWGSLAGGLQPGFGGTQGWIEQMGFLDFAGGTVVHAIGGACALAGIMVVGARKGRFGKNGEVVMMNGHNIPLMALGAFILWFGWFGFNAGSGLVADASIGRICVNTLVGGGAGCLSAMVLFWKVRGVPEPSVTMMGAIGGLVAVTAGCAYINPASAIIIGLVAGLLATAGALFLEKMKLDDVAGAVPVHLFCGIWGTVAIGIFHEDGFSVGRIGVQLIGALIISIGAFVAAYLIFKTIDAYIGLRASDDEQEDGLDFAEHALAAYPDFETAERAEGVLPTFSTENTPPPGSLVNFPSPSDQSPVTQSANPLMAAENPLMAAGNPLMAAGNPLMAAGNPPVAVENPPVATENPLMAKENPFAAAEKPPVPVENPFVAAEKPPEVAENPFVAAARPAAPAENPFLAEAKASAPVENPFAAAPKLPAVVEAQFAAVPKPPVVAESQFAAVPRPPVVEESQFAVVPRPPVVEESQFAAVPRPPVVEESQFAAVPRPPVVAESQFAAVPRPAAPVENPFVAAAKPAAPVANPFLAVEQPPVAAQNPIVAAPSPVMAEATPVAPQQPAFTAPEPVAVTRPAAEIARPVFSDPRPQVSSVQHVAPVSHQPSAPMTSFHTSGGGGGGGDLSSLPARPYPPFG